MADVTPAGEEVDDESNNARRPLSASHHGSMHSSLAVEISQFTDDTASARGGRVETGSASGASGWRDRQQRGAATSSVSAFVEEPTEGAAGLGGLGGRARTLRRTLRRARRVAVPAEQRFFELAEPHFESQWLKRSLVTAVLGHTIGFGVLVALTLASAVSTAYFIVVFVDPRTGTVMLCVASGVVPVLMLVEVYRLSVLMRIRHSGLEPSTQWLRRLKRTNEWSLNVMRAAYLLVLLVGAWVGGSAEMYLVAIVLLFIYVACFGCFYFLQMTFLGVVSLITFVPVFAYALATYVSPEVQRRKDIDANTRLVSFNEDDFEVRGFARDCPICLADFQLEADADVEAGAPERKIRVLKCTHAFHQGCVDPWLLSHGNCPNCRRELRPSDESDGDEHAAPRYMSSTPSSMSSTPGPSPSAPPPSPPPPYM